MNKEQIVKIAAEAAVAATLDTLDKERKKQIKSRQDSRLRNTRLLLKNYTLLKDHCESSISRFSQALASENAIDILDDLENCSRDIYIESIKQSVARTYTIVTHITKMIALYKAYCETSGKEEDQRRYRLLKLMYLNEAKMSVTEACESENIDDSTYYRDSRESFKMLSALIFGIDGLSDMRKS